MKQLPSNQLTVIDGSSPDRFRAIGLLFLRVLQRDSTEAPHVLVAQGKGSTWVAAVFIGAPPAALSAHYLRAGSPESNLPARAATISDAHRIATGPTGEEALKHLMDDLLWALCQRLAADAEAYRVATGLRWEAPAYVPTVEVASGAPEPEQRDIGHNAADREDRLARRGRPSLGEGRGGG